jgi:eukaryotic-like serine/threonine-protein kinase
MSGAETATQVLEGTEPNRAESSESWQAGDRIGRYVLLAHVGAGGMGTVFRAHDHRLDRTVALKRCRDAPGHAPATARGRMQREAQAMAQLSHPNVVSIYDVEQSDDGLLIAMEYVEGTTLEGWLRETHSWQDVLRMMIETGHGLSAAHAAGIVHRDFKPANVLIGADGRPRVTDFGLARAAQPDPSTDEGGELELGSGSHSSDRLTHAGTVVGTPAYMAPEQHHGADAGPAADQFAFCVTLYEALHGLRPFSGTRRAQIRAKSRGEIPPPPGGSHVPKAVVESVRRGLSPDPEQRWPTMDALLRRLERHLAGSTRRWLPLLGGAVVVAGVTAATMTDRGTRPCDDGGDLGRSWGPERREALEARILGSGLTFAPATARLVEREVDAFVERWTRAHAQWCEEMRETPKDGLALVDARLACLQRHAARLEATLSVLEQPGPETVTRAAGMVAALPDPGDCNDSTGAGEPPLPPADPAVASRVATLREALARSDALLGTGRYEDAHVVAEQALEASGAIDHPPIRAEALLHAARASFATERLDLAERQFTDAYVLASELAYADVTLDAAVRMIALIGDEAGRPGDAEPWIRRAEAEVVRFGSPPRHVAMLASHKGRVFAEAERWTDAEIELRRAVELARSEQLPRGDLAADLKDLATVLKHLGRLEEAQASLEQALDLLADLVGEDHPSRAITLDELGNVLRAQGRLEEALELQRSGLDMHRRAFGEDNTYVTTSLNNVAVTLGHLGRHAEAIEHLERAVEILESAHGSDHTQLARMLSNVANAYVRSGDDAKAEQLYLRAHDILVKNLGADSIPVAIVSVNLGDRCLALGRIDDAERHFETAASITRSEAVPPLILAAIEFGHARVAWERGMDREHAVAMARTAQATLDRAGQGNARDREQIATWIAERGG